MPFEFTCPYCFKKTLVEDKYAGQSGPCACCGKNITLPEPRKTSHSTLVSSSSVYVSPKLASVLPNIVSEQPDGKIQFTDQVGWPKHASESDTASYSHDRVQTPLVVETTPISTVGATVVPYEYDLKALQRRRFWAAFGTLVGLILLGFIGWATFKFLSSSAVVQGLQERRNRMMSLNNLSRVARALNAYAATYGTYPPAVIYDENGKPKHSWRVLILPQLGELSLYNRYNFDEPWDSPRNSLLYTECPRVFNCPAANLTSMTAETNCFLITGPGTVTPNQPGQAPIAPRDIGDGLPSTFLLIECANPTHEWTKPIDYDASGIGIIKFGGCYGDGTAVAKADGTAVWVPLNAAPESIKAFMTPNGKENIDPDLFK